LAKYWQVSPDFWLNLQIRHDLYGAFQKESDRLEKIIPLASIDPVPDL
jgi:antitoxin HigA-1